MQTTDREEQGSLTGSGAADREGITTRPALRPAAVRAILIGGGLAAVLDGLNAIVAYRIVLGMDPIGIYQFVASGLLGPEAFEGGATAALLGFAVHCFVALAAAGVFVVASERWPHIASRPTPSGAVFGVGVYVLMNHVVIPLSLIGVSPFSWALFLNGVIGHVLFVGLPIAYVTRHFGLDAKAPSTIAADSVLDRHPDPAQRDRASLSSFSRRRGS